LLAEIRPFRALRPAADKAKRIASLPYDVMDREEARAEIKKQPLSFLRVTRSDAAFPDATGQYEDAVYEEAASVFREYQANDLMRTDAEPCFYIYRQKMGGHEQTGLVAAASVEEYRAGAIKKHELTRPEKEDDRVRHIKCLAAQTGAVFLSYKRAPEIARLIADITGRTSPVYYFTADDGISHIFYIVNSPADIEALRRVFAQTGPLYIADGHHRCAAALRAADIARANNPLHTGQEEYNYFLAVIFPDDMMRILAYNRAVKDLNGWTAAEFLAKVSGNFRVETIAAPAQPAARHDFTMCLAGKWYNLTAKDETFDEKDLSGGLEASILQNNLLSPILGILDPRADQRIQFVGGIRGTDALSELVDAGKAAVAFCLYPTSMRELMAVADAGKIMPPKSTWFEPKLRDGLAVHLLEEDFLK
jgi:uncharacterized protein (DUF1015 family)